MPGVDLTSIYWTSNLSIVNLSFEPKIHLLNFKPANYEPDFWTSNPAAEFQAYPLLTWHLNLEIHLLNPNLSFLNLTFEPEIHLPDSEPIKSEPAFYTYQFLTYLLNLKSICGILNLHFQPEIHPSPEHSGPCWKLCTQMSNSTLHTRTLVCRLKNHNDHFRQRGERISFTK